jgi:hypothetical protein
MSRRYHEMEDRSEEVNESADYREGAKMSQAKWTAGLRANRVREEMLRLASKEAETVSDRDGRLTASGTGLLRRNSGRQVTQRQAR